MFQENVINKWKKLYKKVFKYTFGGINWYYRRLNVGEIREVSICTDQEKKELLILSYGVIHPRIDTLEDIPAGIADTLVTLISNTTDATEDSILRRVGEERDRLGMSDDYLKWKIDIIKSLNYTPQQVDQMNIDEFIQALVLSEEVQGRPLIATGKDDGSSVPQTGNDQQPPEEMENGDIGDATSLSTKSLLEKYLADKKRRKNFGRV